jgi:hypothetical protein
MEARRETLQPFYFAQYAGNKLKMGKGGVRMPTLN